MSRPVAKVGQRMPKHPTSLREDMHLQALLRRFALVMLSSVFFTLIALFLLVAYA